MFPIQNMKKVPLTHDGFHGASDKESIIRAWWKGNPDAGIGIRIPDSFVVLDIDGRSGLDYLNAEELAVPSTLTAFTGNDGYHFWYRLPDGLKVDRRIKIFDEKIDLLVKGYVVAPPSYHPNGNQYKWKDGSFNPSLITDSPDWIISTFEKAEAYDKGVDPDEVLQGIGEGNRDNYLWRYACYLRGQRNLTKKEAIVLIKEAANQCDPPFDLEIAKGKVERAWNYAKKEELKFKPKIYSASALSKSDLPSPKYLVWHKNERGRKEGLVPPGTILVTSLSKMGKSVLTTYVAGHIASGKRLWDYFDVEPCGVLYIDAEQTAEAGIDRMMQMFDGNIPLGMDVAYDWSRMDAGGLDDLKQYLQDKPQTGVVVIDMLSKIWPVEDKGGGNAYHKEYRVMDDLNKLASDYGIALFLVHHDKKTSDGNMITNASGSVAMTGAATAVWNLKRKKGDRIGTLEVTGKTIPDKTLTIEYNPHNFKWTMKEIE